MRNQATVHKPFASSFEKRVAKQPAKAAEGAVFKIKGGKALQGEVSVSGAKNSVLPLLFASLLAKGRHEFHNTPHLSDIQAALKILHSLGLKSRREGDVLEIINSGLSSSRPDPLAMTQIRAGILSLGPLPACLGEWEAPLPGGCSIGARPLDLHLKGLAALGAKIEIQGGFLRAKAPSGLTGAEIKLSFPSVGATENLILAASAASGRTVIHNAAREPEIEDLIKYLQSLGAKIEQARPGEIHIEGSGGAARLKPTRPFFVMPDRIEAGTFLLAGACTAASAALGGGVSGAAPAAGLEGGEVSVSRCRPQHLTALLRALESCGFLDIKCEKERVTVQSRALARPGRGPDEVCGSAGRAGGGRGRTTWPGRAGFRQGGRRTWRRAVCVETAPYPGFPTDLQSLFLVLMTQLQGESVLRETVFESRFAVARELRKAGAEIEIKEGGREARVRGPTALVGAKLKAEDLRGGAALVLAGLAAEGESVVSGPAHILRGYEDFALKLRALGGAVSYEAKPPCLGGPNKITGGGY